MMGRVDFTGTLEAVARGGHAVEVDPVLAAKIGAKARSRVRGSFGKAEYRSNLVSMGGRLLLGVHKATVEAAGVRPGARVRITMRLDTEPLPTDTVPPELASRLKRSAAARAAWDQLAPSKRREMVGDIVTAARPETRERRADTAIARLLARGSR